MSIVGRIRYNITSWIKRHIFGEEPLPYLSTEEIEAMESKGSIPASGRYVDEDGVLTIVMVVDDK